MQPKYAYAALAVIGTILPLWQFAPFVVEHGLALDVFFRQLFSTPVGGFFGLDVIVSSVVVWVFVSVEGRRARVKHRWLPVVATLAVGVSLALPLFLYLRELALDRSHPR